MAKTLLTALLLMPIRSDIFIARDNDKSLAYIHS